jgi:hypothetical protein
MLSRRESFCLRLCETDANVRVREHAHAHTRVALPHAIGGGLPDLLGHGGEAKEGFRELLEGLRAQVGGGARANRCVHSREDQAITLRAHSASPCRHARARGSLAAGRGLESDGFTLLLMGANRQKACRLERSEDIAPP